MYVRYRNQFVYMVVNLFIYVVGECVLFNYICRLKWALNNGGIYCCRLLNALLGFLFVWLSRCLMGTLLYSSSVSVILLAFLYICLKLSLHLQLYLTILSKIWGVVYITALKYFGTFTLSAFCVSCVFVRNVVYISKYLCILIYS